MWAARLTDNLRGSACIVCLFDVESCTVATHEMRALTRNMDCSVEGDAALVLLARTFLCSLAQCRRWEQCGAAGGASHSLRVGQKRAVAGRAWVRTVERVDVPNSSSAERWDELRTGVQGWRARRQGHGPFNQVRHGVSSGGDTRLVMSHVKQPPPPRPP